MRRKNISCPLLLTVNKIFIYKDFLSMHVPPDHTVRTTFCANAGVRAADSVVQQKQHLPASSRVHALGRIVPKSSTKSF